MEGWEEGRRWEEDKEGVSSAGIGEVRKCAGRRVA